MPTWYYAKGDQQFGPILEADLKAMAAAGKLDRSDLVWTSGLAGWLPAESQLGPFPAPDSSQPALQPAKKSDSAPVINPLSPAQRASPQGDSPANPAPSAGPLNTGLYRVHRLFFIAFAGFAVIMLMMGLLMLLQGNKDWPVGLVGLGFLPFGLAHWYAAKGAREGKAYGKTISRVFGTLWLMGFPVGTALGVYVLIQTGKRTWNGGIGEVAVRSSVDILIKNLQGEIPQYLTQEYLPKEAAYERLKQLTGRDFGMNAKEWKSWYKANKPA
jgi:hypothetical protein